MIGPFSRDTLDRAFGRPVITHPLAVIPKGDEIFGRPIFDWSFPGANQATTNENFTDTSISLPRIVDVVRAMDRHSHFCLLDFSHGYRQVYVAPNTLFLQGILDPSSAGPENILLDLTLAFGSAAAPRIFCEISGTFVEIAKIVRPDLFTDDNLLIYIDDIIFFSHSISAGKEKMKALLDLGVRLGVIFKKEKTLGPTEEGQVLGFWYSTSRKLLFLPPEKKKKIVTQINDMIWRRKIGADTLQELHGRLSW